MTLDVEQAWAHPSLFPDPVIYPANLNQSLKSCHGILLESILN